MPLEFTIHKINKKYQGFFSLDEYEVSHSLFSGGESQIIKRELLKKGNAAAVLLFDPDKDNLVLIEQFRIGAIGDEHSAWMTELVAGFIEPGEKPADVIRREAIEEAGCSFEDPVLICNYYVNPASTSEIISLYCAKVDSTKASGVFGLKEEGEDIRVKVVSLQQAYEYIEQGIIKSATPIMALLWLQNNIEFLRKRWSS